MSRTTATPLGRVRLVVAGRFGTAYGVGDKLADDPESRPHTHTGQSAMPNPGCLRRRWLHPGHRGHAALRFACAARQRPRQQAGHRRSPRPTARAARRAHPARPQRVPARSPDDRLPTERSSFRSSSPASGTSSSTPSRRVPRPRGLATNVDDEVPVDEVAAARAGRRGRSRRPDDHPPRGSTSPCPTMERPRAIPRPAGPPDRHPPGRPGLHPPAPRTGHGRHVHVRRRPLRPAPIDCSCSSGTTARSSPSRFTVDAAVNTAHPQRAPRSGADRHDLRGVRERASRRSSTGWTASRPRSTTPPRRRRSSSTPQP